MAETTTKQTTTRATESDTMPETATDIELSELIEPVPIPPAPPVVFPALQRLKKPPKPVDPFAYTDIRDIVRLPGGFQCAVKFASREEYVPFLASAVDVEPHGRVIYADCAARQVDGVPDYFPTDAELLEAAQERIARELRIANAQVTIYQDRVDIDDASDTDSASLLAWKTYRVALNRIPQQPNYPHGITWPLSPTASAT